MSSEIDVEALDGPLGELATTGISRRSVLKKGAIAGGALVWAVPTVEVLGTKIAAAAGSLQGSENCTILIYNTANFDGAKITIQYILSSAPQTTIKQTVQVEQSSGNWTAVTTAISPSGSSGQLTFTTSNGDSILAAPIPSGDTIQVVTVATASNATITFNAQQICASPLTIIAVDNSKP